MLNSERPSAKGKWRKPSDHIRTTHYRARTTTPHESCQWDHIGGCYGPIHVAHVDGEHTNNEPANLLSLCASHHRLLDNNRIDPYDPKMPAFYYDGSGKRRYLHTKEYQNSYRERRRQGLITRKSPYWSTPRVMPQRKSKKND